MAQRRNADRVVRKVKGDKVTESKRRQEIKESRLIHSIEGRKNSEDENRVLALTFREEKVI